MKHIVITGPESSGKTTLAKAIAAHFGVPWVREYAREYLHGLDREYTFSDLDTMAAGQLKWEASAKSDNPQLLVCDTGMLVYRVWSLFKYGKVSTFVGSSYQAYSPDLFLLVDWKIPYEEDPFRENEGQRKELFDLYHKFLLADDHSFEIISGDPEIRLEKSLSAIANLEK